MRHNGILIAVEGIDGSGKSILAKQIKDYLIGLGWDALLTKEPTRGRYGMKIREDAQKLRLPVQEEYCGF